MKNDTRLRIMKMALQLFSQKGYYQTTTKEIALAAKINELTLFRHFGSKANLLQEITEFYLVDANISNILEGTDNLSFEAIISVISKRIYELYIQNTELYKIQMKLGDDEKETMKLKLSRGLVAVLKDYFKALNYEKVATGEPEIMAITLINSLLGAFTVSVLSGDTMTGISWELMIEEHAKQFANQYTK